MGKVLLLYTEKQLETSYKQDCKDRTSILTIIFIRIL